MREIHAGCVKISRMGGFAAFSGGEFPAFWMSEAKSILGICAAKSDFRNTLTRCGTLGVGGSSSKPKSKEKL